MHSAARRLSAAVASHVLAPYAAALTAWSSPAALGAAWTSIGRVAGLHTAPASSSTDIKAVLAEKIPVQQVKRMVDVLAGVVGMREPCRAWQGRGRAEF
jgi:hypothetical protein